MRRPSAPTSAREAAAAAAPSLAFIALVIVLATARPAAGEGLPLNGDLSVPRPRAGAAADPCAAAAAANAGGAPLDAVQVPDPQNCNRYYVCCAGGSGAYRFACRVPQSDRPYTIYSDATAANSYYSPLSGACERTPGKMQLGSDLACPASAPGAPVRPVTTDWAVQVCAAAARHAQRQQKPAATGTTATAAALGARGQQRRGLPRSFGAAVRAALGGLNSSLSAAEGAVRTASSSASSSYPRVSRANPLPAVEFANARLAPLEGGPDVVGEWKVIAAPGGGPSNTGVVGMHAALIPESDKVVMWARRLPAGKPYPEGMTVDGKGQVSAVYDTATGAYKVAPMELAPFCTGQSHLPDGTVLATGGDADVGGYLQNGLRAIRLFRKDADAWEVAPVQLTDPHWYPTQFLLPDGRRTLIVGGYADGESGKSTPSVEIYDSEANTVATLSNVPVLVRLGGLNLYPVMMLLPWTAPGLPEGSAVFLLFAGAGGEIMWAPPAPANEVNFLDALPPWPTPGLFSAFSASGSAALLALDPANGYAAEMAMFGGGGDSGGAACACDVQANPKAYRLKLDQATVLGGAMAWEVEDMPGPRVMVDAVTLPTGKILLVNGAKYGSSNGGGPGGGGQARGAESAAWLYDPKAPAGGRFSILAASNLKRFYHSVAMLLPTGDVLVAGSEQDDCYEACFQFNPALHQFTAELFRPPYASSPDRPTITLGPVLPEKMGAEVLVEYEGDADGAVLMAPAAVTHQNNMNQRLIILEVTSNRGGKMTVKLPPPSGLVAPPGYYMLFVMNGELPSTRAHWVRLTL